MKNNDLDSFNLQLIITEDCNLRCRYCFEHGKNPKYMNIETAKKILENELSKESEFKKFVIDLSGGEVFLHFDFIKELVTYVKSKVNIWSKDVFFFATSNITLLNDEMKQWLSENKNWISLGTSLDGIKQVHDYNRSNSYDDVIKNIGFLKDKYPNQSAKMTIGPDSIPHIYENFKHLEELGIPFTANVVYEDVWGNKYKKRELLRIFAQQLDKLVKHYTKNPNLPVPSLLNLALNRINMKDIDNSWCGSGKYMKAYDVDGNSFPCHRYTYFCAKKHYSAQELNLEIDSTKDKCSSCKFMLACPTCAAYNWQENNNPNRRTNFHCEFIKLQLLATAILTYNRNKDLVEKINSKQNIIINEKNSEILSKLLGANKVIQSIKLENILESKPFALTL